MNSDNGDENNAGIIVGILVPVVVVVALVVTFIVIYKVWIHCKKPNVNQGKITINFVFTLCAF